MSDHGLIEEPLQFGASGRLFGILTLPNVPLERVSELPTFLLLNAGLLHRVGPFRLHVQLARDLARMGFGIVRVDLAGRGDSPARPGLSSEDSVGEDYREIVDVLQSRFGDVRLVLGGLCSGADDAVRIAIGDSRVVGMLLLDPICFLDKGFDTRAAVMKYTNPARYGVWLKRRLNLLATRPHSGKRKIAPSMDPLALRDLPSEEQMRAAFQGVCDRGGRVLSIFTEYALRYYNQRGQLGRVLNVAGYEQSCTERFWPEVEHTYVLEVHRRRLLENVKSWAAGYIH